MPHDDKCNIQMSPTFKQWKCCKLNVSPRSVSGGTLAFLLLLFQRSFGERINSIHECSAVRHDCNSLRLSSLCFLCDVFCQILSHCTSQTHFLSPLCTKKTRCTNCQMVVVSAESGLKSLLNVTKARSTGYIFFLFI